MDWSNLQKDYERLGSFTAVAREYGVSKSLVSQKVKEQGWKPRIDWSDLAELYASGMTLEQLGEHYGCSYTNIAYHMNRLGIEARRGGVPFGHKWSDERRASHEAAVARGAFKDKPKRSEHFRRLGQTPKQNSPSEILLHQALIRARLSFETQRQVLGRYFPDVLLHQQPVIIEADSWGHAMAARKQRDEVRDSALTAGGYRIFRFTNEQLDADADGCVQVVIRECGLSPEADPVAIVRDRREYTQGMPGPRSQMET
jgi:very-short-patch-repair endonuclease